MFSYVVSSNSAQYILCGFNRKNQCAPSPPLFNQIIFIKLSFLNRKVFYSLSHSAVFYYQKKKVCNMEQNKELYEKRQKRRQDAIELKQPDMVPVNYFAINALDYLVEIRGLRSGGYCEHADGQKGTGR